MAYLADILLLLLAALVAPAFLVWKLNRVGVWLGAAVVWGTLILAGWVLKELDLERGGRMNGPVWLFFGWLPSLLYCIMLDFLKRLYVHLARSSANRP